ncbi:MAG: hypothetical protein H6747_09135 [Deltaproteobacteria bacterium]|nr:hypothetical protein [Deltaproteobacteria bacterium]
MHDAPSVTLRFPELDFHLVGWSVAGIETWLRVPEWSLTIDCGRPAMQAIASRHLALTHAHLDHAGGVAGWLGLRSMLKMGHADVYAPAAVCDALRAVCAAWAELQRVRFAWTLHPVQAGDRFEIGGGRVLEALPAHHNDVPAVGWAVYARRQRLRPELVGLAGAEIARRKRAGAVISDAFLHPLLAISGDTRSTIAAEVSALREAEVVLHETTLLDDAHPAAKAHQGGHTHLRDLDESPVAESARFFVPYHVSQRYDTATARELLHAALGGRFGARCVPLLPEVDRGER